MKVRTRTRQMAVTLSSLVVLLGVAGLVQSFVPSGRLSPFSSEVGFASFSPQGIAGGAIVPASCESGLGEGGVAHFAGDTSGNCYVGNACAPNPDPSGYGTACISGANACGQTNSGTIQCNGSCSASAPPDSSCACLNGANNYPTCTTFSAPTALLSASPSTIDSGQSSTLTWSSTHATSCTSAGGFSTGNATSGSASTGALSSTQNYQISCTGPGGSTNSNIATVTVNVPSVSLSASPNRVSLGSGGSGSTTVSWNASNINTCTITKDGTTWQTLTAGPSHVLSGSAPDTISAQTSYTITCTNNASSSAVAATATLIVNVVSSFQEF